MRVLVTGARGQLGCEVVNVLKTKNEEVIGVDIEELDITNLQQVLKKITEIKPDAVVHCAAYTDVDGCEKNIDLAYRVNAVGARNVAAGCVECGAKMVYVSTDYVFDGTKKEPYIEFDTPNPLGVYGKSKLAGEQLVRSILERHFIVRTAWLYGTNGKNFVKTMLKLATERDSVKVVDDQRGTPTYAKDLAEVICELIYTSAYGTYHCTNEGECTWYEFAKKIFELAGIKEVKVVPITTEELGRPAPRPAYSVLRNYMLKLSGFEPMRNWEDALGEFLREIL